MTCHPILVESNGGVCPICPPQIPNSGTQLPKLGIPTISEIEAERCRRSLAHFVRTAWAQIQPGITLHWNWHLEEICKHVQGILEEWIKRQHDPSYQMELQNLILNCPPRSLKSTIVSICAPAWMWLRWPAWKSIFVSANPRVAIRDARGCHSLISCEWYKILRKTLAERYEGDQRAYYDWSIDAEHDADGNFANTSGGFRIAIGFTAVVVGLGGDAIFVDDPNDPKKVHGQAERDKINDTWDLTLCNRVNDYTCSIRVMIMQRVHELDLTGHWVATMPSKKTVHLPMPLEFDVELVVKSPFGYKDPRKHAGECLFPLRYPPDVVEEERTRLGPFGFAAQMNQDPMPLTGGMFDRGWWNFCTLARRDGLDPLPASNLVIGDNPRPKGCNAKKAIPIPWDLDMLIVTVDATFGSVEETASNVGLGVVAKKGADYFVIEDRTKARSFLDTVEAIRELKRDFPSVGMVLIEKKANGAAIIDTLQHEISGIIAIEANENWLVRANAMVPGVAAGNWYLLEGSPWLNAFVSEFAVCPNGTKDDRIDMCSQLAKYFGAGGYSLPDW